MQYTHDNLLLCEDNLNKCISGLPSLPFNMLVFRVCLQILKVEILAFHANRRENELEACH